MPWSAGKTQKTPAEPWLAYNAVVTAAAKLTILSALVVCLLALAAALGAPLLAAGGPIQVVAVQERVNFPGEVGLTLTVEADREIVEVRVFFRPPGAQVWRYAYAKFDPGARIVATQEVPANAAVYLPPGSEVEYYYEIRDSAGNMLTTEPAVVEYLDDRFDWERVQIGPLQLLYHDIPDSRVARTAEAVRTDLARIESILQSSPERGVKGVIYNQAGDARDAFPKQSQTTWERGTFQGFAFSEQGVFVGLGLDRRVIAHESAHLLLKRALGDRATDPPSWLDEGFASYMEPNARPASARSLSRRSLPLRAMNTLSGTPNAIHTFYDKAHSVVAYLIDEHGEDNFRRFLAELSRGRQINPALVEVYGFDVAGLDARWAGAEPASGPGSSQSNGETGPAGQGTASPFVFIDIWIIAGAALVVAALLLVRAVTNKLRRRNDDEDDEVENDELAAWNEER